MNRGERPIAKSYILDRDDIIRRKTIMAIMCRLELNFDDLSGELNVDFREYFASELEAMEELQSDGLVELFTDRMSITEIGRLFLRNIAMRFDAYSEVGQLQQFSKTV